MSLNARDPLGDVLKLVRPEAMLVAELRAHRPWKLAFVGYSGVKFGVVVDGICQIAVRGRAAETFRAGDVYLLGGPPAYAMGSDLRTPAQNGNDLFRTARSHVVQLGDRRAKHISSVIGGRFALDPVHAHLLIDALPALVRIPAAEAGPLRGATQLLVEEVRHPPTGRLQVLDTLAQLVLAYALRWLDSGRSDAARSGWLGALADPRIGLALRHIHDRVETGASLNELARVAGMSRTAFAARFRALVGQAPLEYAIGWRMSLAKDALRTSDRAIGAMAFELGYASESAFSMAFKRVVGCSPRDYRNAKPALAMVGT